MKTFALLCVACALAAPWLHAQQAAATPRPTVPSGPLLAMAPDFSQWTVTSVQAAPAPSGSASPSPSPAAHAAKPAAEHPQQQTIVTKTKPIRREETALDARKIVKWIFPDMQILVEEPNVPVVAFGGTAAPRIQRPRRSVSSGTSIGGGGGDYSKADFFGFDWISPSNYEGIQKVAGQDCLVFRDTTKVDNLVSQGQDGKPLMNVACISADSRLPVALQIGDEVRRYEFGPPPTDMLVPPPDVDAKINEWRNVIRKAALPVAKP